MRVPENRDAASSRWITLTFMRVPPLAGAAGPPVFFLEGGPGSAAIKSARFDLYRALSAFGEVIVLDQRGAGRSEPLPECPEPLRLPSDRAIDEKLYLDLYRPAARRCAEDFKARGIDLDGYDTNESADDIDALRRALGFDRIRLVAMSYGSHLALAVIRRHERHIQAAVLAGVEGPDHTVKLPSDVQRSLEQIGDLVRADPAAGPLISDFVALVATTTAKLREAPARVTLDDGGSVVLSALDFKVSVAGLIGRREFIGAIPVEFGPVIQGDFSAIAALIGDPRIEPISPLRAAMDCASSISAARRRQVAEEKADALLGDVIDFPFPDACDAWGVEPLPDSFRSPLESSVPVLFVSGGLDGRTPPSNAESVRRGFPNSAHVVVDGMGHDTTGLYLTAPRVMELVAELMSGTVPASERVGVEGPLFSRYSSVTSVRRP